MHICGTPTVAESNQSNESVATKAKILENQMAFTLLRHAYSLCKVMRAHTHTHTAPAVSIAMNLVGNAVETSVHEKAQKAVNFHPLDYF